MNRTDVPDTGGAAGPILPRALLASAVASWLGFGVWLVFQAPYASGTDESIRYVAFAAAENRWAGEEDFRRYGIDHYYYPPLYFLLFAPFYEREEAFLEGYPAGDPIDPNYRARSGRGMNSRAWLSTVPASLVRLYRASKLVSLCFGLVVILCLIGAHLAAFTGPGRWWLALLGSLPGILLPQFLYYHTLCNNDSLVNALSAGATLCFVAAARSAGRRRLAAWSGAVALLAGMAVLAKMTGLVLLALFPGIAALWRARSEGRGAAGIGRGARFALVLSALYIGGGGWWLIRGAFRGDWSGTAAHRLAHPWAFRSIDHPSAGYFLELLVSLARSWFGSFAGSLFGIPDSVFLAYLLVPALLALAGVFQGVRLLRRRISGGVRPGRREETLLYGALSLLVLVNLALVVLNDSRTIAPHGRLLFPSLVAALLLATRTVSPLLARRRHLATATMLLAGYWGGLFLWTAVNRLAPAVTQPPEEVRTLSSPTQLGRPWNFTGPTRWQFHLEQPLRIPAGRLAGLRIELFRPLQLPQVGAAFTGALEVTDPAGNRRKLPLRRSAIGDNDATGAWTDLRLASPEDLPQITAARLLLDAEPPVASLAQPLGYLTYAPAGASPWVGAAVVDGIAQAYSFSLAVVYDSQHPVER